MIKELVLNMGIINNVIDNLTFKDTIFLKESSDLQDKYDALSKLNKEYPNNDDIKEELYIVKKGLDGEKEIAYQLKKSNIGMYVLHDINIEYEDLKAQIDYIVVTRYCCYFLECKNLIGNITITDKGNFIREYEVNGRKIKKGIYSPFRQVEAQRDVYKKIWNTRLSSNAMINTIRRVLSEKNFTDIHRVLVVAANNETILNTKYAPKDIKNKVLKSDTLIRKIQYDLDNSNKDYWTSRKETEKWANTFLNINKDKNIDYYKLYKEQYIDDLKERLIKLRSIRSKEMKIPAYYVFTNEELDKLIELKPKTIEELKNSNILSSVKIKTHGEFIIKEINKKN